MDWSRRTRIAESALGIEEGSFLEAYRANREEASAVALEASLVAVEVRRFMETRESWEGISIDLLRDLNRMVDDDVQALKEWPKTGRGLSGKLRRLAPGLRRSGIRLEFDREAGTGARMVTITRTRAATPTEYADDGHDRHNRRDRDTRDGGDGSSPTPSPSGRAQAFEPQPEGDGSPEDIGEDDAPDEAVALGRLRVELGVLESSTLDYIEERRREGVDFTTITGS